MLRGARRRLPGALALLAAMVTDVGRAPGALAVLMATVPAVVQAGTGALAGMRAPAGDAAQATPAGQPVPRAARDPAPPSQPPARQQAVTILVDDAYPPYSYAVNGAAYGVYPAIMARIFARMPAYKVELQPVPWKRGLKLLEQGDGFALAPPYYRPQERPWMDYSAPIVLESVVVYCNESVLSRIDERRGEHHGEHRWPDDYLGLRIGINTGFLLGGKAFDEARKLGRVSLAEARGTDENLKKLLLGRIDCYMNDRNAIRHALLRAQAGNASLRTAHVVETSVISQEQGYLGFTRQHAERWTFRDDFVRQFNQVLEELRRSGEIGRIVDAELRR